MAMIIKPYQPQYTAQLINVFNTAIAAIDERYYSSVQKQAWIGDINQDSAQTAIITTWRQRFDSTQPFIAIKDKDKVIGFIELMTNQNHLGQSVVNQAYIDCLYVHPEYQGQGVALALYYAAMSKKAAESINGDKDSVNIIWVHASNVAKHFFQKQGFESVAAQQVKRQGVLLQRHLMRKFF